MLVGRTPYREFQIPAGVHLIAVYLSSPEISSVSSLVARIQAGHTYSFDSKVDRPIISFSTERKWHEQLIDDATGLPASTQPTTTPTTTSSHRQAVGNKLISTFTACRPVLPS